MNSSNIISSLFWKFMERAGANVISFIVNLVLARLLSPSDYGIISVITIFITLANVFVQGGFNTSLIQKKNADSKDFSSVFYFSLAFSFILYIIMFFAAPFIGLFYKSDILPSALRVLSLNIIIGSINSIQVAYVSKQMHFKKLFKSSILSILLSATVGITSAISGLGVWALVAQQLTLNISTCIIMFITVKWRPTFEFSLAKLKILINFGWKILVSNLITTLFLDIRSLIIGKVYSTKMLGFYNRGKQFPQVLLDNVTSSIQSVMLSAYSKEQDNLQKVKHMTRTTISLCAYITFPMMFGFVAVSEELIQLVLTDKWLPCVPYLKIYCFIYMLSPIHMANIQALKGLGYSGIVLKLDIFRKIMEFVILIISVQLGTIEIAIGGLIASIISLVINLKPNTKILKYSYFEQFKDVFPSMFISACMFAIIQTFEFFVLPALTEITIKIVIGVAIYIILSVILKPNSFLILKKLLNNKLK